MERWSRRRTITLSLLQFESSGQSFVPIIQTTLDTVALAVVTNILRNAVQAVVAMKVQLRVARRNTHTVHLRRDVEQGREVTGHLKADIRKVKKRTLEALPVTRHELSIGTKPARITYTRIEDRVVISKPMC
jgi:hypothetical protein